MADVATNGCASDCPSSYLGSVMQYLGCNAGGSGSGQYGSGSGMYSGGSGSGSGIASCSSHMWGSDQGGSTKCAPAGREAYMSSDPAFMALMGDDAATCCKPASGSGGVSGPASDACVADCAHFPASCSEAVSMYSEFYLVKRVFWAGAKQLGYS